MDREDIERLREQVSCGLVLELAAFKADLKQSSLGAVKYRRGNEIIIVTHGGRGWFDPLSDEKGDVFALSNWLRGGDFRTSLAAVGNLAGLQAPVPVPTPPVRVKTGQCIASRWSCRRRLTNGSPAHHYLASNRAIPLSVLARATADGVVREGPLGSCWFAHVDERGTVRGWEERGPVWRGFSTGGAKTLFRFGRWSASRLCVTEAAIDALSLASIEECREDTLYISSAGGWSPAAETAIIALAARVHLLVGATDHDSQGEFYADKLRHIALGADCGFHRLRPLTLDWNEDLQRFGTAAAGK